MVRAQDDSGSRCCCWFFFSLEPNGWWGWRSMYSETQTKANKVSKMAQLADFSAAQQQYLFCYEYKNSFKRSRVVSITIRFSAKHLDVHCSSSPAISIFNKQIQTISSAALQLFSSSIRSICWFLQLPVSADFFFFSVSSTITSIFHFSLLIVCEQYSHWSLRISVECFHSDHRSVSLTKLLVSHFLVSSFMSVRFLSSHVKLLQAVKLTWWLCCEGFQEQISLPVMLKFREMCWFLMTRQYGRESVHNRSSDRKT